MGMQVYEFNHFYHEGLGYTTNLFATSFYTLTGFHGTHVAIGTLWLGTVFKDALKGKLPPAKSLNLLLKDLYLSVSFLIQKNLFIEIAIFVEL